MTEHDVRRRDRLVRSNDEVRLVGGDIESALDDTEIGAICRNEKVCIGGPVVRHVHGQIGRSRAVLLQPAVKILGLRGIPVFEITPAIRTGSRLRRSGISDNVTVASLAVLGLCLCELDVAERRTAHDRRALGVCIGRLIILLNDIDFRRVIAAIKHRSGGNDRDGEFRFALREFNGAVVIGITTAVLRRACRSKGHVVIGRSGRELLSGTPGKGTGHAGISLVIIITEDAETQPTIGECGPIRFATLCRGVLRIIEYYRRPFLDDRRRLGDRQGRGSRRSLVTFLFVRDRHGVLSCVHRSGAYLALFVRIREGPPGSVSRRTRDIDGVRFPIVDRFAVCGGELHRILTARNECESNESHHQ